MFKSIDFFPEVNLFLPLVYSDNRIVSPADNFIIKSRLWRKKKIGKIKTRNVNAINSGMVVSKRVFLDGFFYDERLTFYGTDSYFMKKFGEKNKFLYIFDTVIQHRLTFSETTDIATKIKIFQEIKKANSIIYETNLLYYVITTINTFIVGLKLSFKYRNFHFLSNASILQ